MALTLTEAHRMIQAAVAKAQELNVTISVAVCDTGGNVAALNRMDGASAVSATVAQGKAAASGGRRQRPVHWCGGSVFRCGPEAYRVLTDTVYPRQGTVVTTHAFLQLVGVV